MRLKNKVVLITASTRGIGLACVKACAGEGARVYMAARNPKRAEAEAEKLRKEGLQVKWVYHDAAKPGTFVSMVEETVKDAGRIDVLVNNFGGSDRKVDLILPPRMPMFFWILSISIFGAYFWQGRRLFRICERLAGEVLSTFLR